MYVNWGKGQPDNKDEEDCVHLKPSNAWNDITCLNKLPYICQKPMGKSEDNQNE